MKYRLEITEAQLNLIAEAVESYCRIGSGQMGVRYIPILNNTANGSNKNMIKFDFYLEH